MNNTPSLEELKARMPNIPENLVEALWHLTEAADSLGWNIFVHNNEETVDSMAIVKPGTEFKWPSTEPSVATKS